MPVHTGLMRRLQLAVPIVQAPMAGGGDTPALVAAVSEAGGLGFIGAAYLSPEHIGRAAAEVRRLTPRPFGINLFAPTADPAPPRDLDTALERVAPYFADLGLDPPAAPSPAEREPAFRAQIDAVLASGAAAFSFTFGLLPPDVHALVTRRMVVIGTATTVDEARALEAAGADAVVAQGSEAGGHRGSFAADFAAGLIGTIALVPQVVDAVTIPVIASGGIMDGRGIAAALALGADAAQMGTAFLACDEAGVPDCYKAELLRGREDATRITRAFSGRPARGLVNRFMRELDAAPDAILPFPLQNDLTRPMRRAAAAAGRAEFLSLWAGQGVRLARRLPAAELMKRLVAELEDACGTITPP